MRQNWLGRLAIEVRCTLDHLSKAVAARFGGG
jgi:hypothetical protein